MSVVKNIINLCFVTDNGYAMPTCVTLTSILKNKNFGTKYKVYIMCKNVDVDKKQKFLCLDSPEFRIILIDLDDKKDYSNYRIDNIPATPTSIYKFFIPEILSGLDKVLFLDGDIIVRNDLSKLYKTNIKDIYLAAVVNADASNIKQRINYFNSGVMLMNLSLMRKDHMPKKLLDYRMNGYNGYMDQDAFNIICRGKVKFLPFKFNTQLNAVYTAFIEKNNSVISSLPHLWGSEEEKGLTMDGIVESAEIIHYTSAKPFKHFDCLLSSEWYKYFYVSPYSDFPLNLTSNFHFARVFNSRTYRMGHKIFAPMATVKKHFLNLYSKRAKFLKDFYEETE